MQTNKQEAIVIAHIEKGDLLPTYYVNGQAVRLFVVDENAPSDRVYEITTRHKIEPMAEILGNDEIGHINDNRHDAVMARYEAEVEGRAHPFRVIENSKSKG